MICIAKSTFTIPMENGTETYFIKNKEYYYADISNGNVVVMDENKTGVQLDRRIFYENFFNNLKDYQ